MNFVEEQELERKIRKIARQEQGNVAGVLVVFVICSMLLWFTVSIHDLQEKRINELKSKIKAMEDHK